MQLLKEIADIEIPSHPTQKREAARAVVFDEQQLVPLLFASVHNFHKLPGGGIDAGESIQDALVREMKEEVGCTIKVTKEVGKIIEYRSKWDLYQTSYCYLGTVITKGAPDFTEKEISDGFQIIRLSLDDAIAKIQNDTPANYEGFFIQQRDLAFLKKAREII